ncbi:ImmA/IrrE family metallo-endopeptidase [Dermabacter vaginalis]|uniref:ImmA/IrrE family metallo-endopeptidase n=1 Tax=Dermabacter vaginalis TaxID=1630135 RepID=A0ABX6A294_9MICO|nr:ImmA/IrrE family metallo-endopeptidase [Dermabacter vaginalis]
MSFYSPWDHLRTTFPRVRVEFTRLEGRCGETNGRDLIRLDERLLQVERRCTLAHELVHVEAGEGRACSASREREVNRIAAARLVPFEALVKASRWAHDPAELAEELWVTRSMLEARCETLTAAELFAVAGAGK